MSEPAAPLPAPPLPLPAAVPEKLPRTDQILRQLFLTLFLRGRTSRGLQKRFAPTSIGKKLAWTLFAYTVTGLLACMFVGQPIMALAIYLHGMTFVFLGMFVAASAGEILFNKDEAEILLHRPISPRVLLWSKVRVLVEVSLWLGVAFNLAGFLVGLSAPGGGWQFPIVHLLSTALEALFCTSFVIMVYQLCLRWFGRERLESLMTSTQVVVVIAVVLAGQILPRVMFKVNTLVDFGMHTWWIALFPPVWFAGFDDALAGSGATSSFVLTGLALAGTGIVLAFAFGKLAQDYQSGLQSMSETVTKRPAHTRGKRWLDILVNIPPLSWWQRNPVERAAFLLTAAYMARDRDLKLRLYPSIAPLLIFPIILLFPAPGGQSAMGGGNVFIVSFLGNYLGLVPMLGLVVLQYSQQWQAGDLFRAAPMTGPGPICHGARRAILVFLTFPLLVLLVLIAVFKYGGHGETLLLLPGVIALPIFALLPHLGGRAVPLSSAPEEAKSSTRGLILIVAMMVSAAMSGLAYWAWSWGWYAWLLLGELILAGSLYAILRRSISNAAWSPME